MVIILPVQILWELCNLHPRMCMMAEKGGDAHVSFSREKSLEGSLQPEPDEFQARGYSTTV